MAVRVITERPDGTEVEHEFATANRVAYNEWNDLMVQSATATPEGEPRTEGIFARHRWTRVFISEEAAK